MDELKELSSVLERVWKDMEVTEKIDFDIARKILKSEADNQEDLTRAKQTIILLIEEYVNKRAK